MGRTRVRVYTANSRGRRRITENRKTRVLSSAIDRSTTGRRYFRRRRTLRETQDVLATSIVPFRRRFPRHSRKRSTNNLRNQTVYVENVFRKSRYKFRTAYCRIIQMFSTDQKYNASKIKSFSRKCIRIKN